MRNFWIVPCVAVPLCVAGVCIERIQGRVERLEQVQHVDPAQLRALDREFSALDVQVKASIAALRELSNTGARTEKLDGRLAALECDLQEASATIDEQRSRIARFEALREEIGPKVVEARIDDFRRKIEDKCKDLNQLAQRALGVAETTHEDVTHLEKGLARDKDRMWKDLLGPTVQLMGEETVGSGVLLASEQVEGSEEFVTYLLTAWHVIRDIQTAPETLNTPVPVTIYGQDGKMRSETAQLLRFDATLDIALLKLNSARPVDCGAKLAPRAHLHDVAIFEQIYAVGCPLGNDPIPTFGEIADTRHIVDGQSYWMISAPTYIGNSGGGVFDADTHELLGIFTKIYTHGTLRPTVVPHMGLATPLPMVYDWLEEVGFASLEPAVDAQAKSAAAHK